MTQDDEIWSIERGFWLKGDDHMRTHTGETCIMIFPSPVGILRDGNVFEGLKSAPRWDEVEISDQVCQRLEPDAVLIAYKARGERGGERYEAWFSSTYLKRPEGWRLYLHQQTPIPHQA